MEYPEGEGGRGTWLMLGEGAQILDLQRLASLFSIITLMQFCSIILKGERTSNLLTTLLKLHPLTNRGTRDYKSGSHHGLQDVRKMINSQWMFKLSIHQWIASINLNNWLIFQKRHINHLKRLHFLISKHLRRPPFWKTTRMCFVRQPLTDLTHVWSRVYVYISFYSFHFYPKEM